MAKQHKVTVAEDIYIKIICNDIVARLCSVSIEYLKVKSYFFLLLTL